MTGFRPAVGVVGANRLGLCLAEIAARNGRQVVLYTSIEERAATLNAKRQLVDKLPELKSLHKNVTITTDPAVLAEQTTLVLCTMSREYVGQVLDRISGVLDGAHFVVHAVHILEGPDLERSSEIIRRHTCVKQVGAIAGPAQVSDLLSGHPNAAVVGSSFPAVVAAVRHALGNEHFQIQGDEDLRAVELAASLGQVVAIAVGMVDGAQLGSAAHATVFTRGLLEMADLGKRLGAAERTFFGLAGIGRLVDALRRNEPNYRLGFEIGSGVPAEEAMQSSTIEALGVRVNIELDKFATRNQIPLPICRAIASVLEGSADVATAFDLALQGSDAWT